MLVAEGLKKSYPYGATALCGVDFRVESGRTLAVLAKEGGGKSSLLHCLAGLGDYEGSIRLAGRELKDIPPREREIRLIHHDGGLLKGSVKKNFTYPLRLRGYTRENAKAQAKARLDESGLSHMWEERTRFLYPDDVLRLAFARTRLTPCRLLLADNPFALAPSGERGSLFRELSPTFAAHTTVFATDSLSEAQSAGDEILVLHCGVVQGIGSAERLYAHPDTLYLARLLYPFANVSEGAGEIVVWGAQALAGNLPPEAVYYHDGYYYHLLMGNYYRSRERLPYLCAGEAHVALVYDSNEKLSKISCAHPKEVL